MMSLHRLPQRIARDIAGVIGRRELNTGDVVLKWDAALAPTDRNVEASYPAPDRRTATIAGLVHYVSVRGGQAAAFTEIQAGDAIVTFGTSAKVGEDVVEVAALLAGRALYFTLPDGKDYVQASAGKSVMQFWDTFIGGAPLSITLLLRLKT